MHIVSNAFRKGYVHQIMLSHDAVVSLHGLETFPIKDAFDDYTYIARVFLPMLQQAGVTVEQVNIMLKENPQRMLAFDN